MNWKQLDKEWQKEYEEIELKKTKSGSIAFIEDKDKLNSWEIYHTHWEDWLSSSAYFKNWQEKINSFQTPKEVGFYMNRLRVFIDFVKEHTRKDIRYVKDAKPRDPINTPKLIEQELKWLENINEEEFNKTDKWINSVVFKELSTKEMLNDPWFSKEIDNLFGLENEKLPKEEEKPVEKDSDNNIDYANWTKEQLISEINRLNAEIEQLKNNQTLTSSERQERLQKNQQKLEKLEKENSIYSQPNNSNDGFPTGLLIGWVVLVIIGLVSFLVIKSTKKIKKRS